MSNLELSQGQPSSGGPALTRSRAGFRAAYRYLGFGYLRDLRWIILVGLTVRFILLPLSAHPWDDYVWYITGNQMYSGSGLYGGASYTYSYPPVWGGFLYVTDGLYRLLAGSVGAHPLMGSVVNGYYGSQGNLGAPIVVDWLFVTLTKLPLVLFDLLTTLLICRLVRQRLERPELGVFTAGLFFLNPYIILISSVWGQFDVIATYLLLLGLLLFLDHHPWISGIVLGVSVATKYFPIVVFVIVAVTLYRRENRSEILRALISLGSTLVAISLPFLLLSGPAFISGVTGPSRGNPTAGTLSVWGSLAAVAPSALSTSEWITPVLLGAIAVATLALGLGLQRRNRTDNDSTMWIEAAVLSLLCFYALYRTVNIQYLVWIFPFITLDVARRRATHWWYVWFSGLSILLVADAVFSVRGTSFFLPAVTISRSFVSVFPLFKLPDLTVPLALVTAVLILAMLFARLFQLLRGNAHSRLNSPS